jgi:hypothetical protein
MRNEAVRRGLIQVRPVAALLLLSVARLDAQSAATVPASSGFYDRVEAVSALVPIRSLHLGLRPMSRREADRVVTALAVAASRLPLGTRREWAEREIAELQRHVSDSAVPDGMRSYGATSVDLFASDARSERITTNGLGVIDAVSHPFASARSGWPVAHGLATTMVQTGVLAWGTRGAIAVEPRFSVGSFHDRGDGSVLTLHRAYGRIVASNVFLQVGADESRWGQSPHGPLFISGNAAAPPAISIGFDTAMVLPWILRLAGPIRFHFMVADLGPTQDPPHTKLAGWQVSIQPWSRFEIAIAVATQQGGDGGPSATLLERVVDLLPLIDALAPQRADLQISNKVAGGNLRLRFPELGGLDLYYELQIDDFDLRRFESTVIDDFAHALGLRLPIVTSRGQFAIRGELHNTGLRFYQHHQFRSGYTFRRRLIGSPLGSNAKGFYVTGSWLPSALAALEVTLAHELRDPSLYTSTTGPFDEGFKLIRLTDDPDHRRTRIVAAAEQGSRLGSIRLALGYNRAWRTGERARKEWLGQLTISTRRFPTY